MRWVAGIVLAGCGFHSQSGTPDASNAADAPHDTPGDIAGLTCLGSGAFEVCVATPTSPFAVHGTTNTGIDTDASTSPCVYVAQGNRPSLCVIAATTITIDENILYVSGSHPAVLFATETIEIGRGVDVGSHANGQAIGAGSNAIVCLPASGAGSNVNGGDGGAGGSFGSRGGNGGAGGGTTNGDTAGLTTPADVLRGGCSGDDGGNGIVGAGHGNRGGGAVLLLAGTSITITGFVNASGGGGGRGTISKGGGGGGGSGGMIAMDAPAISVTGTLAANGGGGGGGASGGAAGQNGQDPDPKMPTKNAGGGSGGGGQAGTGAAGAAGTIPAGNTGPSGDGAGGAGGGLGAIRVLSGQTLGGTSSPMPTS